MTRMLFHERPVAPNRKRYSAMRPAPADRHCVFAETTIAMPAASTEFAEAARVHPLAFGGDEAGACNVAALVGLRDGQNPRVDCQSLWASGCCLPACARRYPFVLAQIGASNKLTVCIDEVHAGLGMQQGQVLSIDDGSETHYLKRVLGFLSPFPAETQRIARFATHRNAIGLQGAQGHPCRRCWRAPQRRRAVNRGDRQVARHR